MPDIIITPGSGLIDFYPSNKTASIYTSGNDLAFANPSGNFEFISGNVAIGTTTPSGNLHVIGTGLISSVLGINTNVPSGSFDVAGNAYFRGSTTGTVTNVYFKAPGYSDTALKIRTDSSANLYLDAGPNIKVGNQDGRAEVNGSSGPVYLSHTSNANGGVYGNQHIRFAPAAVEAMRLTPSGLLGIGTTVPSGKLSVIGSGFFGTINSPPNALLHAYSATSGDTVLNVEGTNGSLFSIVDSLSGTLMAVNNSAGLPVFEVFSDDSIVAGRFNQNDFVISSGGNVGIGTSSPVSKLQVSGLITANSGNFTNSLQLNGTGVSISGHTHTASNITDFNSAVSGLLPTIANSGDNRVLTSTGSSVGINAESNLTFDGTTLGVVGNASVGQVIIENNIVRSTSGNLFLMPLGALAGSSYTASGAIIAASGGDARGIGAVDLQMNRLSNDQVASAQYSAILAGIRNKISSNSTYSAILAGSTNAVSGSQYSCVGGSTNTVTSASYGFVFGNLNTCKSSTCTIFSDRNTIQSTYQASILGGQYNSISGLNVDQSYGWSVICAGYNNSIKAAYSNFIGGGIFNTIDALDGVSNSNFSSAITAGDYNTTSSTNTFIGGGDYNTISASGGRSVIVGGNTNAITASTYSAIGGGKENVIAAHYSHIPGGYQAKTVLHAEQSHSAGKFENVGDAQHTVLIARKTTTDNTANQVLFLDDSSARLTVPAKTTWTFQIKLSAYNDTDSAAAGWIYRGVIKRDGSNNTSLVGSIVEENWKDTAMNSATSSVVADDTNEALEIRVTGLLSKNIRWVAVIDISQVSYSAI